jgi:hypothetical protein
MYHLAQGNCVRMLRGSQPILRVLQGFGHDGGLPDDAGAKLDLLFRQTVLGRELADLLPRSPFHDKQLEDAEVVAERKSYLVAFTSGDMALPGV